MDSINLVVEGAIDALVMVAIFNHLKLPIYGEPRILNGKKNILKKLTDYNNAAKYRHWVVVIDMDDDADCAVTYRNQLLPHPTPLMRLRIAVRAIETWLLADADHLAKFLEIPLARIPQNPEDVTHPKDILVALARLSKNQHLREDIVPHQGSDRKIGLGYISRIQEFLTHPTHPWQPEVAQQSADSLRWCIRALSTIPKI